MKEAFFHLARKAALSWEGLGRPLDVGMANLAEPGCGRETRPEGKLCSVVLIPAFRRSIWPEKLVSVHNAGGVERRKGVSERKLRRKVGKNLVDAAAASSCSFAVGRAVSVIKKIGEKKRYTEKGGAKKKGQHHPTRAFRKTRLLGGTC